MFRTRIDRPPPKSIRRSDCKSISSSAFGWGKTGHRIVAHLAWMNLEPAVKKEVEKILGNETVEEASLWPDRIKSEARYQDKYSHNTILALISTKTSEIKIY